MSTGLDDLIHAIIGTVGLDDGDDPEDLSLDWQYACACGADAIYKLQKQMEDLRMELQAARGRDFYPEEAGGL